MKTKNVLPDLVSYFKNPVTNIWPLKAITLHGVFKLIKSDLLKAVTLLIRKGAVDKSEVLPYITPSGCFDKRSMNNIKSYSSLIHLDIDKISIPAPAAFPNNCQLSIVNSQLFSLVQMLSADKFLNPALIFISPSGNGIKFFIRIRDYDPTFHQVYIQAASEWLFKQYNLEADPSCKDIARACFLCFDPYAYYSDGFCNHTELLEKLPAREETQNFASAELQNNAYLPPIVPILKSLNKYFEENPDYGKNLVNKLNSCWEVHDHAVSRLIRAGWRNSGIYWKRPGKVKGSNSATYRLVSKNKYVFRNFSLNGAPFEVRVNYSDVSVIALLEFDGIFSECVAQLYKKYRKLLK